MKTLVDYTKQIAVVAELYGASVSEECGVYEIDYFPNPNGGEIVDALRQVLPDRTTFKLFPDIGMIEVEINEEC
jgi:hypothetical protein